METVNQLNKDIQLSGIESNTIKQDKTLTSDKIVAELGVILRKVSKREIKSLLYRIDIPANEFRYDDNLEELAQFIFQKTAIKVYLRTFYTNL